MLGYDLTGELPQADAAAGHVLRAIRFQGGEVRPGKFVLVGAVFARAA